MSNNSKRHHDIFALKSLKAAKVSEISETTAAAAVSPEQRVNFHIGNPIQDERLTQLYRQLIFGLPLAAPESISEHVATLPVDDSTKSKLEFFSQVVGQSVAYLPRGGFSGREPGPLAERVQQWLGPGQEEPLEYDLGTKSARREITFVSGGLHEALRMIFAALSTHLERHPVHIHHYQIQLTEATLETTGLNFHALSADEHDALEELAITIRSKPSEPHFLLLGRVMSEESRRKLRSLSLELPLFFIEGNGAQNYCSLGREAGLSDRVLRIIDAHAIHPSLGPISLAFVVGNSELIQAIETTHFELKGTPSAPEVELCAFLMQLLNDEPTSIVVNQEQEPAPIDPHRISLKTLKDHLDMSLPIQPVSPGLDGLIDRVEQVVKRSTASLDRLSSKSEEWVLRLPSHRWEVDDPLAGMSAAQVAITFFERWEDQAWHRSLQQALLASFLNHHPEYSGQACTVVSGSARTSFGILGRHCGIQEVVTPDLSWTYEHAFSKVTAVPLTETLDLDVEGMITAVAQKLEQDSEWRRYGAVVLNNPHNASGAVFNQDDVARLVRWLLENRIRIIDDLSYEGVVPGDKLENYDTVRRIVSRLKRQGSLRAEQVNLVTTIHSFSKTDCLAGARLAVAEILELELRDKFKAVTESIKPNLTALLMVYLFYRRQRDEVQQFWNLRNKIMGERMQALERAVYELPNERNPYNIRIEAPLGSMYPRLVVEGLPPGVSLDWLASGLAPRGIGLLPFSTFARTAKGFELARKSFRLTLGGQDGPFQLQRKTRRVIIDLNRLIEDQETLYSHRIIPSKPTVSNFLESTQLIDRSWKQIRQALELQSTKHARSLLDRYTGRLDKEQELNDFIQEYLPERLEFVYQHLQDRAHLADCVIDESHGQGSIALADHLVHETRQVSLDEKQEAFWSRMYDRTVHPTQMYSIGVENTLDQLARMLLTDRRIEKKILSTLSVHLAKEYLGSNVPISSDQESDELVLDLNALIDVESWSEYVHQSQIPTLLSFWGDWDGSTRPSGQGHRLVAGALLANVMELSHLLRAFRQAGAQFQIDDSIQEEARSLEENSRKFWALLNEITTLTGQLEERYLRVLPFDVSPGFWRRIGMRLNLARDPISLLWQHNDRLERRMLKLREERGESLERYFYLNQQMQTVIRKNIDFVEPLLRDPQIAMQVGQFRNRLQRFVLTPRIHQRMIQSRDQFAIDTTVHNIVEINGMAGKYGVPGVVLALQVSMSTDPEALIALDRKLSQQRQDHLRRFADVPLPNVSVVPLFEDLETIEALESYLDQVWEYAVQSRHLGQDSSERFREILSEVFFAGSDLSQQVGQPAGEALYRRAKYQLVRWLSEHNLTGSVRTKLGSGETAQRQGGYYRPEGSAAPVLSTSIGKSRLSLHLGDAERRAWELARSPLRGVQSGGEFRTFQSNLSEQLRRLPTSERLGLLYHIWLSQGKYESELERAASALENTRLHFEEHSLQELKTITKGASDPIYREFLKLSSENFRQILYGRDEDVIGIHVISHFISRAMPPLRDRPVVRPTRRTGEDDGQEIVGRLARTLPLSKHGSMLRAIGHNRAQTMMLGVNQFTCGLFRAMNEFSSAQLTGSERKRALEDYVLTQLNVYDMLNTLRLYHDPTLANIRKMELAFPAGNSAFIALREDNDLIARFVPNLQRELLRRNGMDVEDAYRDGQVKVELLPALRPQLAVLLQPNLFNTKVENLLSLVGKELDRNWIDSVQELLQKRERVATWRGKIWEIIETPIRSQVESFVALAIAIHTLSEGEIRSAAPLVVEPAEVQRLGAQVAELLRGSADDPLRHFLIAAVQYLTELPGSITELPVDVLRALRDVERIVKIEEQALGQEQQELVRFYMLKIARLCGENG